MSKILALMVYSGITVPSTFAPGYNRVHADVEFWKQFFVDKMKPVPETVVEEVKEPPPPAEGT